MLFIFPFCIIILVICEGYILPKQWKIIEHYLKKKDLQPEIKNEIENIIFKNYLPLAYRTSLEFTKYHKKKCLLVNNYDLKLYSIFGLYQAVKKYNGKSNFYQYAKIYIKGALYTGLTELYPISKEKKTNRRRKRQKYSNNYDDLYQFNNFYLGKYDKLESSLDYQNKEKYYIFWEKIQSVDSSPFSRRLFNQKFSFEFENIYSNRYLSELNSCSEETVRKNIHNLIMNVTMNLTDLNIYV